MNHSPSITYADDSKLAAMIGAASRRVVLLAPGVSESVADALGGAWRQLGAEQVTVILDVDPEVCRLGFGTLAAVEKLRAAASAAGTMLHHQPGVRIGVLVCHDQTLVYSPPPLLIEAGSTQPQRPNAIELGPVPEPVAVDLGLGENPDVERTVGLDPVRPNQIEEVKRDLEAAPPAKFDLARRVRVFNSRFQFVELSMSGCFLSRKRVPIPSNLIGLARTRQIERQFHAHFDMMHSGTLEVAHENAVITEKSLQVHRLSIEKRFLTALPGYGMVVRRGSKEKLQHAVDALQEEVGAYRNGIKEKLDAQIRTSRDAVIAALLPAVKNNPPDEYCKIHGPKPPEDWLERKVREEIEYAFGTADALIARMEVKLVFKDVAYESLTDPKFLDIARKAMPGVKWLHVEFDASKAEETTAPMR